MNQKDARFFRPLWIRVLLTAALAIWCGIEIVFSHDQLWIGITAIGVVYCIWNFFLHFTGDGTAADVPKPPPDPPAQP